MHRARPDRRLNQAQRAARLDVVGKHRENIPAMHDRELQALQIAYQVQRMRVRAAALAPDPALQLDNQPQLRPSEVSRQPAAGNEPVLPLERRNLGGAQLKVQLSLEPLRILVGSPDLALRLRKVRIHFANHPLGARREVLELHTGCP